MHIEMINAIIAFDNVLAFFTRCFVDFILGGKQDLTGVDVWTRERCFCTNEFLHEVESHGTGGWINIRIALCH